ncbi:ParA family protein [Altererythrobacter sp. H2]|uniref:ParA family protein n=1 Tax=Altererythrobacter sp. H2 TaxID=3108391 RepID=UPI000BD955CA|nr:ParA family protein [Altererythrobacter sp. H2]OZA94377.1 MAG: chromosome partitioning protein ParA [Erythrobacter sp. 34-65-8]WRK96205.1 ParA family protein [Altererythrobacter sp. H2]
MAVIAVYSVKGGVGKTTLAANLAWCSAELDRQRTLLWDLDAAGGAAFLTGLDPAGKKRAGGVFARDRDPASVIRTTAYPLLDVLPADDSLWALDRQLTSIGKKRRLAKLAEELGQTYPRIVLDCPPVLNEVSAQVLRAADLVVVPLPPSPLSSRAFELVAEAVREMGKGHPPMLPVLSMVDRRRALHRAAMEANPGWPVIPWSSAIEQCAVRRAPVGVFARSSPGARCIAALWQGIERKLAGK